MQATWFCEVVQLNFFSSQRLLGNRMYDLGAFGRKFTRALRLPSIRLRSSGLLALIFTRIRSLPDILSPTILKRQIEEILKIEPATHHNTADFPDFYSTRRPLSWLQGDRETLLKSALDVASRRDLGASSM